jgi:hypothetical protein
LLNDRWDFNFCFLPGYYADRFKTKENILSKINKGLEKIHHFCFCNSIQLFFETTETNEFFDGDHRTSYVAFVFSCFVGFVVKLSSQLIVRFLTMPNKAYQRFYNEEQDWLYFPGKTEPVNRLRAAARKAATLFFH